MRFGIAIYEDTKLITVRDLPTQHGLRPGQFGGS
jgi:hypothetical protein